MKRVEMIFIFIMLTALTLFTVALMNMVNDPNLESNDIKITMDNSMGLR